jgi:hypothetical protein
MFSANVYADIWGPASSELTVTGGGKRRPDGSSDFLIWEMAYELRKGDQIVFSFEEGTKSSPKGAAFDDRAPSGDKPHDFSIPQEEISKLEASPRLSLDCRWRFIAPGGQEILVAPNDDRQNVSIHLLWNEMRAQRIRVNLSKSSLREITSRSGGEEIFLRYVEQPTRIELTVGA